MKKQLYLKVEKGEELSEVVKKLEYYKKHGDKKYELVALFNDIKLYSSWIDMDCAYTLVVGCTRKTFLNNEANKTGKYHGKDISKKTTGSFVIDYKSKIKKQHLADNINDDISIIDDTIQDVHDTNDAPVIDDDIQNTPVIDDGKKLNINIYGLTISYDNVNYVNGYFLLIDDKFVGINGNMYLFGEIQSDSFNVVSINENTIINLSKRIKRKSLTNVILNQDDNETLFGYKDSNGIISSDNNISIDVYNTYFTPEEQKEIISSIKELMNKYAKQIDNSYNWCIQNNDASLTKKLEL